MQPSISRLWSQTSEKVCKWIVVDQLILLLVNSRPYILSVVIHFELLILRRCTTLSRHLLGIKCTGSLTLVPVILLK